jgi:hypothetical protein
LLPRNSAEIKYVRGVASGWWLRTASTHERSAGLVRAQRKTLVDYRVTYARILQGERALSRGGVIVKGARGHR